MSDPQQEPAVEALTVVSGNPSAVELAAVSAVIDTMLDEIDAEESLRSTAGPNAWQRSQRETRPFVHPGRGAWRAFSG